MFALSPESWASEACKPLAVTAGMGIWEQAKMPERIFEFIGARLRYR